MTSGWWCTTNTNKPLRIDKPFVSEYAKAHPAEDLAESFSRYMYDRKDLPFQESARSKMGEAKWQYLVNKYPEKLKREL